MLDITSDDQAAAFDHEQGALHEDVAISADPAARLDPATYCRVARLTANAQ